jgi:uncharacterized repeat protein (TIGR04138 family)
MQPQDETITRIEDFILGRRPYKTQAYLFIMGALEFTLHKLGRKKKRAARDRHVTGQELSHGIKDYAISQFGPTARMVLDHWGLRTTADFGRVVYDLIELGFLGKNDRDRIEDFNDVFDLDRELIENYRFKLDG